MRPLVWFRADLRTADNPALDHAVRRGAGPGQAGARGDGDVIAVFLLSPEQWRMHDWGDVRVDFVLRTLAELRRALWKSRIPLLVRSAPEFADAPDVLLDIARRHGRDTLLFNREYEVNERRRDAEVTRQFEAEGLDVRAFTDQVVVPPGAVRTKAGGFYTVFTPYRKAWLTRVRADGVARPVALPKARAPAPSKRPAPGRQASGGTAPTAVEPDDVPARVRPFAAPTFDAVDLWPAGEAEAARRLRTFVRRSIAEYDARRDLPAVDGTSALSPYLATGAISPRQCLFAACAAHPRALDDTPGRDADAGATVWVSELIWREFYRHVLVGYPRVSMHRPFKPETARIRWRRSDRDFEAWCAGRTGVPIVDAAMRQLLATGWMHNRLRMITAMFLAKDLLIDWRRGERHFMRHLIDGDLASNNGGWQWAASTGTDAVPYFRVFNPARQSRRFDPDGAFIRRFVPELADVPADAIHDPWASSRGKTPAAIVTDYPPPIVDHGAARERVLQAFGRR